MKNVGLYGVLIQNSIQKTSWKQFGFLKFDEQMNLIFADKLCVALFCHIHQWDQQMGGIGLRKRIVHDQNLSLIFICKNVRIIPSHIIQKAGQDYKCRQKSFSA